MLVSMHNFITAIMALSSRYQLSVHSWLRSPKHNADVGGVENSMHLMGLAVDIYLDRTEDRKAFIKSAKRLGLRVIEYEGSESIHLQID